MSKIRALVVILIAVQSVTNGQTHFNKIFDLGFIQTIPYKIFATDSELIISGTALTNEGSPERSLFVAQYDVDGYYLSHNILLDDNEHFAFTDDARDIIRIGNKVFVSSHEVPWTNREDSHFDIVSSYDLNTNHLEIHHIVRDSSNLSYIPFSSALAKSKDDKLLLVISLNDGTDNRIVWLQKIDPNNKNRILDEFRFSKDGESFAATDIVVKEEGFVLLGYHRNEIEPDYRGLFTISLDKALNLIELRTYDNLNYFNFELNATQNDLGDIVFLTQEFILLTNLQFPAIANRPIITKLNSDLDIQWQTKLGQHSFSQENFTYTGIVRSSAQDGYIICGNGVIDGERINTVAKLGETGDSIWLKNIIPFGSETSHSEINDISKTSDGNYVLIGFVFPMSIVDSVYVAGWMLKIDEQGNIVETGGNSSYVSITENSLKIFPNPVSDFLFIETEVSVGINLILRNIHGQQMHTEMVIDSNNTYYFDTKNFPSGTYFSLGPTVADRLRPKGVLDFVSDNPSSLVTLFGITVVRESPEDCSPNT